MRRSRNYGALREQRKHLLEKNYEMDLRNFKNPQERLNYCIAFMEALIPNIVSLNSFPKQGELKFELDEEMFNLATNFNLHLVRNYGRFADVVAAAMAKEQPPVFTFSETSTNFQQGYDDALAVLTQLSDSSFDITRLNSNMSSSYKDAFLRVCLNTSKLTSENKQRVVRYLSGANEISLPEPNTARPRYDTDRSILQELQSFGNTNERIKELAIHKVTPNPPLDNNLQEQHKKSTTLEYEWIMQELEKKGVNDPTERLSIFYATNGYFSAMEHAERQQDLERAERFVYKPQRHATMEKGLH